jgi:hypothetical protein
VGSRGGDKLAFPAMKFASIRAFSARNRSLRVAEEQRPARSAVNLDIMH